MYQSQWSLQRCRLGRYDGRHALDIERVALPAGSLRRTMGPTTSTTHGPDRKHPAAVAVPGICLQPRDLGIKPSTFELMCVRVVSGTSSFVAAVVYRPGSTAVSAAFFDELSDVIDLSLIHISEPTRPY